MNTISFLRIGGQRITWAILAAALWTGLTAALPAAVAQEEQPAALAVDAGSRPAEATSDSCPLAASKTTSAPSEEDLARFAATPLQMTLRPFLSGSAMVWFAVIVILALSLTFKPILCIRNLDALVLAALCLLLAARDDPTLPDWGSHTWTWRACLGLSIGAGYWLLRGTRLLLSRRSQGAKFDLPAGVLLMMVLAGLAVGYYHITDAPNSDASIAANDGAVYYESFGKLPYGDVAGSDNQSPLLYMLHAGVLRFVEPTWITDEQLINLVLFILMAIGVSIIGHRLHSAAAAHVMVAILCVFPGTLECLSRPDIMLPATLLTWSVALALLPGVGSILGTCCLVLTGIAWPWAWLGLPLMLGHFFRRGAHAVGSLVGLAGGVALICVSLLHFVEPAIPRSSGALARAGTEPKYTAYFSSAETVVVQAQEAETSPEDQPDPKPRSALLWRFLVNNDATTFQDITAQAAPWHFDWPTGVDPAKTAYYEIAPLSDMKPSLQAAYRKAMATQPTTRRLLAAARTVLEATWFPTNTPEPVITDAWTIWSGPGPAKTLWLFTPQQWAKLALGLLTIWATLALFFGRRTQPRQLVGGLLIVTAGTLLASGDGAVTNLVWCMPLVLALWATPDEPETNRPNPISAARPKPAPARSAPSTSRGPFFEQGPEPRITTDERKPDAATYQLAAKPDETPDAT